MKLKLTFALVNLCCLLSEIKSEVDLHGNTTTTNDLILYKNTTTSTDIVLYENATAANEFTEVKIVSKIKLLLPLVIYQCNKNHFIMNRTILSLMKHFAESQKQNLGVQKRCFSRPNWTTTFGLNQFQFQCHTSSC